MSSIDAESVSKCEETARDFGQAFQNGEFDELAEFFEPGAVDEFIKSLTEAGLGTLLSDDPVFVFRRCRRAMEALYGPIESLSVTESTIEDGSVVVTAAFHCENETTPLQIECTPTAAIDALTFPDSYTEPGYVDSTAFEEYPVTIECGDIALDALVTMPTRQENPSVALLVPGAGEVGKNYESGPNQFFKDLAWGLASEGVATLRYDKREAVTDIQPAERTLDTLYFSDGVAALERTAAIETVDSSNVVVIGHSQGGRCAFEIARRYGDVAGVAALDSPLLKPLESDPEQYHDLLEIDGEIPPFVEELTERYVSERERFFDGDYEHDGEIMNIPVPYLESTYEYDQFEAAKSLSVPIFIYQMALERRAPEEKRARWDEVASGEQDVIVERPELNHNFQRGDQPRSLLEPVLFHRSVDTVVIDDLATWITDITG